MTYNNNTDHSSLILKRGSKLFKLAVFAQVLAISFGSMASAANLLTNTATAKGTAPGGVTDAVVAPNSTINITVTPKTPSYSVIKTAASNITTNGTGGVTDYAGDTILYTIKVKNTGNVSISNVVVTDPGPSFGGTIHTAAYAIPAPTGDAGVAGKLEVGEEWTYNITYTLSTADVNNAAAGPALTKDKAINTVSVTAKDPQAVAVSPTGSTLSATQPIPSNPLLTVAKNATVSTDGGASFSAVTGSTVLAAGNIVKYSFLVTNTGNVTMTNVSASEIPSGFNGTGGIAAIVISPSSVATLLPGANTTFNAANYTVTQADIDTLQ